MAKDKNIIGIVPSTPLEHYLLKMIHELNKKVSTISRDIERSKPKNPFTIRPVYPVNSLDRS